MATVLALADGTSSLLVAEVLMEGAVTVPPPLVPSTPAISPA
jgi:hypothetical protein